MSTSASAMGMLGVAISAAAGVGCCSCACVCVSGLAAAAGSGVMAVGAAFSGANGRRGSAVGSADASAAGRFPRVGIASEVHRPSCQDEMVSVTRNAMLVSPHIRKRWFMVFPARLPGSLPKRPILVPHCDGFCIGLPALHRGGKVGT